jgi:hypothetical protein
MSSGGQRPEPDVMPDPISMIRRLIPFPGMPDVLSPLTALPLASGLTPEQMRMGRAEGIATSPLGAASIDDPSRQAAAIVSQAAAILDQEMANGVLAAHRAGPAARHPHLDAGHPVLRQVHELIDSLAGIWPQLHGTHGQAGLPSALAPSAATPSAVAASAVSSSGLSRSTLSPSAHSPAAPNDDTDPLAELRPHTAVRAGQRATISMTLFNSETIAVDLVPAATDLLGSRGGSLAAALLQFTPATCRLEPQAEVALEIGMTVPANTAPGSYSGLLVVRGVDYLRALITIDVV